MEVVKTGIVDAMASTGFSARARTIAALFTVAFACLSQPATGQQITVEFTSNPDQSDYRSVIVSYLPDAGLPLSEEDSEYAIRYEVGSIRPLSGRWLIDQELDLTEEEVFVKSWFLAYKDVADLSKFENVLSASSLIRAEEQYASGERPRDWEYEVFDPYADVRLLGLARYGYAYLFIVEMDRIDGQGDGNTTIRAIQEDGEYRQSGTAVPLDDATSGLTFGVTADLIVQELKRLIGI